MSAVTAMSSKITIRSLMPKPETAGQRGESKASEVKENVKLNTNSNGGQLEINGKTINIDVRTEQSRANSLQSLRTAFTDFIVEQLGSNSVHVKNAVRDHVKTVMSDTLFSVRGQAADKGTPRMDTLNSLLSDRLEITLRNAFVVGERAKDKEISGTKDYSAYLSLAKKMLRKLKKMQKDKKHYTDRVNLVVRLLIATKL